MNLSRKRKIATAAATLVGAVALFPSPASADSQAAIEGARATFTSSGEIFRLYDTACDGNPVYLKYWFNGVERRLDHSGGCGTHAAWNLDLPENRRITYQACVNIRPSREGMLIPQARTVQRPTKLPTNEASRPDRPESRLSVRRGDIENQDSRSPCRDCDRSAAAGRPTLRVPSIHLG